MCSLFNKLNLSLAKDLDMTHQTHFWVKTEVLPDCHPENAGKLCNFHRNKNLISSSRISLPALKDTYNDA